MLAKDYDYIFLGAGCASLSIIIRMLESKKFEDKKILLIDKEAKTKNDRTWCFWEQEPGYFEDIVYRKWNHLFFYAERDERITLDAGDYEYKMIRGIDFYKKCFSVINNHNNVDVVYGEVSFVDSNSLLDFIQIDYKTLSLKEGAIIFNSIYFTSKQKDKFYLLQHFKGWIIETPDNFFAAKEATLMDFRVNQNSGTTFVYVLPLSASKALVEFTLFSKKILPKEEYDASLGQYLQQFLGLNNYEITEEEFGIIPMTNADMPFYKNNMYHIGTAGGQTKPSTGYTFRFIQKQSDLIVKQLMLKSKILMPSKIKRRFSFYDSTLLHILSKNLLDGKYIFSVLFKKNKAKTIFKFLDNESTILQEIRLLNTLPKKIFIKAGFTEFVRLLFKPKKSTESNNFKP